jgi:hypothetical protein
MAVNFADMVYLPAFDTFARPVTFIPFASRPGELPYDARGIFDTMGIDVVALDGSIISEQRTILDIREVEFTITPVQHDQVIIPAAEGLPDAGTFEVTDTIRNGGGETTLHLQKLVVARP